MFLTGERKIFCKKTKLDVNHKGLSKPASQVLDFYVFSTEAVQKDFLNFLKCMKFNIQLFRERLSEKKRTRQSRKVLWVV